MIATLFAFIPSFAMVLGLAPFVRSIRAGSRLGRAMTAIGAAVVAAIALLAAKLAVGAFLIDGRLGILPVAVAIISAVGLFQGRISTPLVVLAAAAIGMLAKLVS